MDKIIPKIREIAERISKTENRRMRVADFLKNISRDVELKYPVRLDELKDVKVIGVDGGLVKKNLHGFDCILTRSAGVCFHYKKGVIKDVKYWPSKMPAPVPEMKEMLSELDFIYFSSLMRVRSELKTAIKCTELFKPNVLLLDGSIVPHYSTKPSKSSESYELYAEVVELCKKLFHLSEKTGTILAGVIEDSRSSNFCKLIKDSILSGIKSEPAAEIGKLLDRTRDTALLYLVLEKGEQTVVFPYAKDSEQHIVLKGFGKVSNKLHSFYLKTSSFDRPVKVDFLGKNNVEKLSSVLVSISGHNPHYGIPAPLIEADHVAKLSEEDMDRFYSSVCSYVGNLPGVMKLRREQRPF
jgi:hypothetical protein